MAHDGTRKAGLTVDTVYMEGITATAVIGVYAQERHAGQPLVIDLSLGCDTRAAAAADDLSLALDYDAISRRVVGFVEGSSFQLLESLAERLAALLLEEFPVLQVRIRVSKPGAAGVARDVGVVIERQGLAPAP